MIVGVVCAGVIGVTAARANTDGDSSARTGGYGIPLVVGAVPYWDEQEAQTSIDNHSAEMDVASPWSYAIQDDGAVVLQPGLTTSNEQAQAARMKGLGLKIIPTIANTTAGLWDTTTISNVIKDPKLTQTFIASVVHFIQSNGFDGIQMDCEDLLGSDRDAYSAFITDLAAAVHRINKVLYVTVHAKETDQGYDQRNLAQNYAAIGAAADLVCLMAYDWHWGTGPAGPIGPYDWVERVIKYAITQIPANKIMLGLGLFGYDWVGSKAENLTWRQIVSLAEQHSADELWDVGSQSPHFSYTADGVKHDVWYENGRSVSAKFGLARQYRLGGVELWRLGAEDPAVWEPGP